MGHQIIKQPNGKYCLYSSERDGIILNDLDAEGIYRFWSGQAATEFQNRLEVFAIRVRSELKALDAGNDMDEFYPYWAMGYAEALRRHQKKHGNLTGGLMSTLNNKKNGNKKTAKKKVKKKAKKKVEKKVGKKNRNKKR